MHGDVHIGRRHQLFVSGDVVLKDRRFKNIDLRVLRQVFQNRQGTLCIEQRIVKVHVDFKVLRHHLARFFDLGPDIEPRTALGFVRHIALFVSLGTFQRHIGYRRVDIPPGEGSLLVNLFTQQGMHGNLGCFRDRIKQRHLQPGPEVVIPHQRSGILPLRPLHGFVGSRVPGVIQQCLTEADMP